MNVTLKELNMIVRKYEQLVRTSPLRDASPARSGGMPRAAGSGRQPVHGRHEKRERLLETCRDFMPVFAKSFDFPHLLVLADAEGEIVQRWGDEGSILKAAREGLYPGNRFALADRGVNAFSVAMTLARPIFLQRGERSVRALADWNAFVFPLRGPRRKTDGYFAFLFPDLAAGPGVGPFLHAIAMKMEQQYEARCRQARAAGTPALEERLNRFGLTARESQVASYWVLDYDYKQISKAIGISENTVRVIVGRINGKLKVNSKASMILRLFDAI